MAVAFHRGLTHELILKLQLAGIRIEDPEAHRALAGLLTREVDNRGNPIKSPENQRAIRSSAAQWVETYVEEILEPSTKQRLMRQWEEDHPGKSPYPPTFAEVVLDKLRSMDPDDAASTIQELIELAQAELLFG